MKSSLLQLDPLGDALLILRCPNEQRIPPAHDQESSDSGETDEATPSEIKNKQSVKSPKTWEDLESLPPYLDNGDANEIQFRVSTRHLCIVSPVFKAMIEGKYKESQPNNQGLLEIGASDWNAHALIILLDIIHGHHYQVPRKLDVEIVAHIGLLVDYYDCLEVVQIFFDRWRLGILDWTTDFWGPVVGHPASKRKSFGRNGTLLLFIAWAFRCSSAFSGLSSWAIVNTEGVIETDLPIPTQVPAKIDEKRVEFIDQLFSKLYSLQEDLVVGRVGCSLECSCRLLGYLMKQMRASHLPATKPDKPFTGWSIPGVVEIIRSIKTPTWRNSSPADLCSLETHLYSDSDNLDAQVPGLKIGDFQGLALRPWSGQYSYS
ncbi:hypothetical protein BKA59DRAFT_320428 [Fusarium tricinctum]|uniref:BTB domain-containing protein n=1 Tax=Fusarium tricinctum TaxID=61284 RepID=A0A8K0W6V5_9HYPO|nr:hypothetical protein BKA59DRAFT_320428 [Fusarium tricinctum]